MLTTKLKDSEARLPALRSDLAGDPLEYPGVERIEREPGGSGGGD